MKFSERLKQQEQVVVSLDPSKLFLAGPDEGGILQSSKI